MSGRWLAAATAVFCVFLAGIPATTQQQSRAILVTLPKTGEPVAASEFELRVGNQPAQILRVQPPEETHLRLALLIDDTAGATLTSNLAELRGFLEGLPGNSTVLVAYKHGGSLKIEQPFTSDLAAAVAALRVPAQAVAEGNLAGTVVELLAQFPAGAADREQILYVGEGTNPLGDLHHDPSLNRAIRRAQDLGVALWALHVGSDLPQLEVAGSHLDQEAYLDRLAKETGGQTLALGLHPPSLQPYLQQLRGFFDRQYRVEFQPPPGSAGKKLVVQVSGGRQSALFPER